MYVCIMYVCTYVCYVHMYVCPCRPVLGGDPPPKTKNQLPPPQKKFVLTLFVFTLSPLPLGYSPPPPPKVLQLPPKR